jgi:hypothetical protein
MESAQHFNSQPDSRAQTCLLRIRATQLPLQIPTPAAYTTHLTLNPLVFLSGLLLAGLLSLHASRVAGQAFLCICKSTNTHR